MQLREITYTMLTLLSGDYACILCVRTLHALPPKEGTLDLLPDSGKNRLRRIGIAAGVWSLKLYHAAVCVAQYNHWNVPFVVSCRQDEVSVGLEGSCNLKVLVEEIQLLPHTDKKKAENSITQTWI